MMIEFLFDQAKYQTVGAAGRSPEHAGVAPLPNRRISLDVPYSSDDQHLPNVPVAVSETIAEEVTAESPGYPVWCIALYDYTVRHFCNIV